MAGFPALRLRRLRRTPALRAAFAETSVGARDLVAPLFVKAGIEEPQPVATMPGVVQHTADSLREEAERLAELRVGGVLLFGVPTTKDAVGSAGWDPDGPVPTGIRVIREVVGDDLVVWADVCSCEYTDHGHCGPLDGDRAVDNDAAVEGYVRESLVYADAGADIVAPSGMMDGQVTSIRAALDAAGHEQVAIVAYAAKYASGFYGPFRDAAESGMAFGDRAGYQMAPTNAREAMREIRLDVDEGADVVMVKPALPYLDVLATARRELDLPLAAYQVSGEYAMVRAADERGWLDGPAVLLEAVTAIRRAGADQVVTYGAADLAERLR